MLMRKTAWNLSGKDRFFERSYGRRSERGGAIETDAGEPMGKLGCTYEIELIDTWDMTIHKLPGTYSGSIRVDMPGKQYMAVRMKKV